MTGQWLYWIFEIAFLISGIIYAHTRKKQEAFGKRISICIFVYIVVCTAINLFFHGDMVDIAARIAIRMLGFCLLLFLHHFCWKTNWSVSVYDTIWAVAAWQLVYELWRGIGLSYQISDFIEIIIFFAICHVIALFTISRWMPEGAAEKIGPRQLTSAILIFFIFETIGYNIEVTATGAMDAKFLIAYLSQVMLALILYLQNELFKKSVLRQELAVMNLLWKKEQEQYQLSKENIALINQKCHDLKHQIRAIRNSSKEDMENYLEEVENSIQIYESIVKTGNEVLDTILTEKSLYCRERGITVSCVADGSQMEFIHTVDLYAILGNALDNAIEAVEKFEHQEKRQIDVLIYRQQNFLVINVINPLEGTLIYDEELPVTTKEDKRYHGYGLRSMQYLVKKYDGYLSVSTADGCFSLKILMPIPANKEEEVST